MKDYLHTVVRNGKTYNYLRPGATLRRHKFPSMRLSDDIETAKAQAALLAELRPEIAASDAYDHLVMLIKEGKRRARQRKMKFTITEKEVKFIFEKQGRKCAVSGLDFDLTNKGDSGTAFRRPFAPSLDRIDSTVGYELGNVRIVCCAVNLALNEWGLNTFLKIAEATTARNRNEL